MNSRPATGSAPTCRVLLVGEGPSDVGPYDEDSPGGAQESGFLAPIVRRLVARTAIPLEFVRRRVTSLGRWEKHHRLAGHADKAAKAVQIAASLDCRAVVFCKDVDRTAGRRASGVERRRKLGQVQREIARGFGEARHKDPSVGSVVCVKATPCRMIEAWALGDAEALRKIATREVADREIPGRPEECWGTQRDPNSGHPKRLLQRILGVDMVSSADFAAIGVAADLGKLRRACPESFAPFADEVEVAVAGCAAGQDSGGRIREGSPTQPK